MTDVEHGGGGVMQEPQVRVEIDGTTVANVTFEQSPGRLTARKAMDGIVLQLPIRVQFTEARPQDTTGVPLITELHVTACFAGSYLGRTTIERPLRFAHPAFNETLNLVLTAEVARRLESRRNAGDIAFELAVVAVGCRLRQSNPGALPLTTQPFPTHGSVTVRYDAATWTAAFNAVGLGESVVVELPLRASPGREWDEIWSHVRAARTALARGGPSLWEAVVVECRKALELWRAKRAPSLGSGDAAQRTHLGAHPHGQRLERRHAALVLANTVALLSIECDP
jgi:hypothetical protein